MKIRLAMAAALVGAVPMALGACVPEAPITTTTTTTEPVDPWVGAEGCYRYYGIIDILYTGEKSTFGNARFLTSTDGSCSGAPDSGNAGSNSFVEAPDESAANALCDELDPGPTTYNAYQIADALTPNFPVAEMWSCNG